MMILRDNVLSPVNHITYWASLLLFTDRQYVHEHIVVIKHHDHKQLGEERVFLLITLRTHSIAKENQGRNFNRAGTWTQQLKQRS